MLVQLGNDAPGHGYKKHFEEMGVGSKYVKILDGVDTGQAYIMALKDGNNSIIIVGASNAEHDPKMTNLHSDWEEAIKEGKCFCIKVVVCS